MASWTGTDEANTLQRCSSTSDEDARRAVHGDDFVCLSDKDELNHVDS